MRILQVFNRYLERGGEEASVERISDSLSQRHKVFHCYFDSRQMENPTGVVDSVMAGYSMIWNRQSAARLRTHTHAAKPDVLLLHNIFPIGTASILHEVKKLGIPAISYIHNFRPYSVNGYMWANEKIVTAGLKRNFIPEILAGSWQNSVVKTGLYGTILTGMHASGVFRNIKVWVAISEFMRQKFIEAGVPANDIFTLLHSWDPLPILPDVQDHGYYLFLGRLISAKGVRMLFETWDVLEKKLGPNCPRLIIAGHGPLFDELKTRSSVNSRIEVVGQVDGKRKEGLIRGCRAMIAPSLWWEPLGLVTYEAYDYAKPMLAAKSGGLTETVQHGITGMLHEPGNSTELAEQIIELECDVLKRERMGRLGREWLLANTQRYHWLDGFDQILAKATSG